MSDPIARCGCDYTARLEDELAESAVLLVRARDEIVRLQRKLRHMALLQAVAHLRMTEPPAWIRNGTTHARWRERLQAARARLERMR